MHSLCMSVCVLKCMAKKERRLMQSIRPGFGGAKVQHTLHICHPPHPPSSSLLLLSRDFQPSLRLRLGLPGKTPPRLRSPSLSPHTRSVREAIYSNRTPLLCSRLAARSPPHRPPPFPLGDFRIILLSVRHTVIEVEKGKGATEEKEEEGSEGGRGWRGIIFSHLSEMMT